MKPTVELWRCDQCGELHKDEDSASQCCPATVTEGYGCSVCGALFIDDDCAVACCPNSSDDPDAPLPLDPAELEAAGQERLFA